ncbi:dihydroxyacetone kinase subunit DhaL [Robertmurraya kyonggiensis]|uniref:phosphoenolpyruvate--glycerone phosphotransferase n=1 Tax=Robertmurraya kyonggiensis TaxID=1037680 RepID=A0A4V5P392_9BACI|nr:dihydroxyacetone kinase subunit DhaL [Robertmurraya kyonggiensis]TKC18950.1 dihydroxyacetone kinase subunit L [Robertmurraya kyonggiensis]
MKLDVQQVLNWLEKTNEKIQMNKEYLTSLDRAIGDGDHGINMSRGFQEVIDKTSTTTYTSVSDLFKDVAMTLLSKVGGASGPLYGTAFLKMSMIVKNREPIDKKTLEDALESALEGILQRGKANLNDKTLVDVWTPVVDLLKDKEVIKGSELEEVSKNAMESTKERMAKKGRAAYLKERSIGHLDPGSVSSYYLFASLAEVLSEEE